MSCGFRPKSYICHLEEVLTSLRDERNELRKNNNKLLEDRQIWGRAFIANQKVVEGLQEEIKKLKEQLDAERYIRYSDSDVLGRMIRAEKSAEREYNKAIKANKEAREWALKCGKLLRKIDETKQLMKEAEGIV